MNRLSKLIILLLFINTLTSCNNKTTTNTHQKQLKEVTTTKTINLVGTWLNQGERETLLKDFVRYYNFLNQETEVVITFSEEIEDYAISSDRFITKELHKPQADYDIILLNNCYYLKMEGEPYWAKKYLVDFSEFDEFKANTMSGLITDSLKNIWHGIIPGPLVEGFSYTLWCNNNVAKKAGIEVKQIGMTFDDFANYIKAVYSYNNSHSNDYIIPIMEGGADWKTLTRLFEQLYASLLNDNTEYFSDSVSEKKLRAWHKTLNALEELSAYEPFSPKWRSMAWTEGIPNLLKDKCLFYANGSWLYSQLQESDDDGNLKNIMPTEFPVFGSVGIYPAGFQIPWGVPKNAPHKDEAINFLLTLNNSQFAEDWVRKTKSPTGIKGSVANVTIGLDQFENFIYNINRKYGNSTFVANGNETIFGTEYKQNNSFAYEVLEGSLTANEAMQQIRKDLADKNVEIVQN